MWIEKMKNKSDVFEKALMGINIPPLTLDNKWYSLFRSAKRTAEIERLEKRLKELIKEQAHVRTEVNKLKNLKTQMMDEIILLMNNNTPGADKKRDENTRFIDEIKDRLLENEERAYELPKEIDECNRQLMLATMEQCYEVIENNTEEIEYLDEWINEYREKLKENIIRKQDMEIQNVELYSYMHDIFGPRVVSIFDIKYDIEEKKQEIIERQRALREKRKRDNDRK